MPIEPVSAALIGGGALLLLLRGKGQDAPVPPPSGAPPKVDPCGPEALQSVIASAAAGAGTGAAGGPQSAGASAGVGVLLNPATIQCAPNLITKAFKDLCGKADRAAADLKRKGFEMPKQYNSWSCEQRLAFIAALTTGAGLPVVAVLVAGNLAIQTTEGAKRGLRRAEAAVGAVSKRMRLPVPKFADDLLKSGGSAVEDVKRGAKKYAKKVGLGGTGEIAMAQRRQDVDFGYLGNFGVIASGTGTQSRGNFGYVGRVPQYVTQETKKSSGVSQETKTGLINAGASIIGDVLGAFLPKRSSVSPSAPAPAPTTVVVQGGSSLPSWALPVIGLGLVGVLVFSMSKRR